MLYDVALRITQQYDQPITSSRQILRLMPLPLAGEQQVIAASLTIEPQTTDRSDSVDFFGNTVVDVGFAQTLEQIVYRLSARVRRETPAHSLPLSPMLDGLAQELANVRSLGPDAPHHFLPPSIRAPHVAAIEDFALSVKNAMPHANTLALVQGIGSALHAELQFDADATTVDTPVTEAFEARRGVCQDFSHIMIVALRALGIPAGYVSGFLRTIPPPGQERLQGADAMHAWVMAWCGFETGWIEYDPTNDMLVATDHIVVARGRDYADVAPVKGSLRTSGMQDATHAVDIIEVPAR